MLMNYVELKEGIPSRLHFTDNYIVEREIWDELLDRTKVVRSLTFWCDREDGVPTAKTFSILADNLADQLRPYLPNHEYRMKEFIITKRGVKFAARYSVMVIPFVE